MIVQSKGSSVSAGGSLTINAGNTAKIEGSDVSSGETLTIDAKDVDITAAENTSESSSDQKHAHVTMNVSSAGVSGSVSADKTNGSTESTTWTNSHLNADNIVIKSDNDTTVSGATVTAEDTLDLDVGGNLTVESKQDTTKERSLKLGVSAGGSGSGANAGANFNMSKKDSELVDEQTMLTGGKVDIDVEKKTTLTGAVITSDTGDLDVSTGSLVYADLKGYDRSVNAGASVGTSVNVSTTKGGGTVSGGLDNGSFGMSNGVQNTRSAIGAGTITVRDGSNLSGLSRNAESTNTSVIEKGVQMSVTNLKLTYTNDFDNKDKSGFGFSKVDDFQEFLNNPVVAGTGSLVVDVATDAYDKLFEDDIVYVDGKAEGFDLGGGVDGDKTKEETWLKAREKRIKSMSFSTYAEAKYYKNFGTGADYYKGLVMDKGGEWNENGVNIVGLRNDAIVSGSNTSDDIFVMIVDNKIKGLFVGSTDPGVARWDRRDSNGNIAETSEDNNGVAHVADGQYTFNVEYNNAEKHNDILRPTEEVYVNRDLDKDGKIDNGEENIRSSAGTSILFHYGGVSDKPVGDWSWGCQTIVGDKYWDGDLQTGSYVEMDQNGKNSLSFAGNQGYYNRFINIVKSGVVNNSTVKYSLINKNSDSSAKKIYNTNKEKLQLVKKTNA